MESTTDRAETRAIVDKTLTTYKDLFVPHLVYNVMRLWVDCRMHNTKAVISVQ